MARTTISIPDDLKKRMARVKNVNWSGVAAEAFQLKLGELARNRKEKSMETVIERLRASKIERASTLVKEGREAGAEWAKETAEFDELGRLSALNTDEWFTGQPPAPWSWPDLLAFQITGTDTDEVHRDEASEIAESFWSNAIGSARDQRLGSDEFLGAFIEGADSVFKQVVDKL